MPSEIGLCFFKATIEADRVLSYILLAWKLNELAKTLKYASPKQKDTDNDKYAMRCWLLRLGFIGDECKTERKILLKNLEGNSAFRQIT